MGFRTGKSDWLSTTARSVNAVTKGRSSFWVPDLNRPPDSVES